MNNLIDIIEPAEVKDEIRKTVVCVTNQLGCERIIQAGAIIAKISGTELEIVSVLNGSLSLDGGSALDFLFKVSRENNANMSIFYSDTPYKSLVNFIKQARAVNVITGIPEGEASVAHSLREKFTHISFFSVAHNGEYYPLTALQKAPSQAGGQALRPVTI